MEKLLKTFSTSTVLIICGTVLSVYNQGTLALVLISLGVLGSIVRFSLQLQKEKEEKEEREKLYAGIAETISNTGIKIPYVASAGTDQIH